MSASSTLGDRDIVAAARGPVAHLVASSSTVAEATMHAHVRYDQFVEWSAPVLEKYSARPSALVSLPQV